jgi:hypothetical protein
LLAAAPEYPVADTFTWYEPVGKLPKL